MTLNILMKTTGVFLLLLAAAHAIFPRLFHWKEDLSQLSLLNRQIFFVHTFFIVVVLVEFGALNLFFTQSLLEPVPLSRAILAGMASFWFLRLIVQLFVYDPNLWRGSHFRTAAHVMFTAFWSFLTVVYISALVL